jgi:hypothetical protein
MSLSPIFKSDFRREFVAAGFATCTNFESYNYGTGELRAVGVNPIMAARRPVTGTVAGRIKIGESALSVEKSDETFRSIDGEYVIQTKDDEGRIVRRITYRLG